MLSYEMKAERVHISWELLEHFEKEGEDFLKKIITGDETWVHHYDHENKRQSIEYCHKEPPQLKKFKRQAWVGKVMLTVFWKAERVVLVGFLEKETINSQCYTKNLNALKRRIKWIAIRNVALFQHNARPHTSAATRDAIQCLYFSFHSPTILSHRLTLSSSSKNPLRFCCTKCTK